MFGLLLQAQTVSVSDSFKDTFNFLQGDGVYEDGVMHFLQAMKATIWGQYDTFIADAQALAAIFMIIFFSIKCYEMMSGDKQLEVMPLLRPFALVMVILWWGTFTQVVAYPTTIVENKTEALFNGSETNLNDLRVQRAQLMVTVADSLMTMQAQTETASTEAGTWYEKAWDSVTSAVKDGFSAMRVYYLFCPDYLFDHTDHPRAVFHSDQHPARLPRLVQYLGGPLYFGEPVQRDRLPGDVYFDPVPAVRNGGRDHPLPAVAGHVREYGGKTELVRLERHPVLWHGDHYFFDRRPDDADRTEHIHLDRVHFGHHLGSLHDGARRFQPRRYRDQSDCQNVNRHYSFL
jgi:hypothetical protein